MLQSELTSLVHGGHLVGLLPVRQISAKARHHLIANEAVMYAEDLPDDCPPMKATDRAFEKVYRLVKFKDITDESFYSKAKLKEENPTKANTCVFASCSLVIDPVEQIRRYPKMRGTFAYAAELSIPMGSGRSEGKKHSNHVNFWPFKTVDMKAMVVDVIELPEVSDND